MIYEDLDTFKTKVSKRIPAIPETIYNKSHHVRPIIVCIDDPEIERLFKEMYSFIEPYPELEFPIDYNLAYFGNHGNFPGDLL